MKFTKDQIEKLPEYLKRQIDEKRDNNTGPTANLERGSRNEPVEKKKTARPDRQACVSVYARRATRLKDHRANCEKYAIDSLVSAGILQDDSKKFISRLDVWEEVGYPEHTRIVLEW